MYDQFRAAKTQPGAIVLDGYGGLGITTAGTPLAIQLRAMRQVDLIRNVDGNLDDIEYLKTLFAGHTVPKRMKLLWRYYHLDLGLWNEKSGHFFLLMKWPN